MKKGDILSIVLAVSALIYLGHVVFPQDNENGDLKWTGQKITDGVLTYMVKPGNDLSFKTMVDSAFNEWEELMGGFLVFEKVKRGDADITFDEVPQSELGQTDENSGYMEDVGAKATIIGNPEMGTITHVNIKVADLGKAREGEQYALVSHKIGNALGIVEYSDDPTSVMYHDSSGYDKQKVTDCDSVTVLSINFLHNEYGREGCYGN